MSDHKRIYIGGLTPDISQDDVSGRCRPFGQVLSCEIIKAKEPEADSSCRGFAYVTLQPKDEASLARMLSLYNGCKWRGQRLRVEVAKPDYLTRLQQEWQDEKQQQQAEAQQQQEQEQQQQQPAQGAEAAEDAHILRLTVPGSKRKVVTVDLTSKSKSHRAWFPAAKMKRPAELDWEPLPPTKRAAMQAAADACVPLLDAATAAQQLAATQELLARIAEQQRQQERVLVVPQAEGEGVEVAFSYQQQQQQPQQQTSGKKNASRVVEQELMSQLKLLKRISEREQHEQGGRISGSSRVVDFLDGAADSPGMQQAAGNGGGTGTAHAGTEADDSDSDGAPIKQGSNNRQQQQQQQSRLQPVPAKQQRQQGQQLKQNIKQQQQQEKEGVSELSSEPAADSGVSDMSELSGDSSDYESDQWEQWLAAEGLAEEQEGEGQQQQQQQQQLRPPAADKAAHRQPQQQQRVAKQKDLPQKQQPPTKQQQQQQLKPQPGKASLKHPVPAAATTAAVNKAAARVPAATQPNAPAAQPPAQPKGPAEAPSPPAAAAAPPPAAWDLDRFGSDSEEVEDDDSDTAQQGPLAAAAGSRPTGAKGGRPRGDVLLCPVVKTKKGVGRV